VVVCANGKAQAGGSFPLTITGAVVGETTALLLAPSGVLVGHNMVAVGCISGDCDLVTKNKRVSRSIPSTSKISNKPFRLCGSFMAPPNRTLAGAYLWTVYRVFLSHAMASYWYGNLPCDQV
jgi:hypothetical protein